MPVAYAVARLRAGAPENRPLVLELQRHLRKLGYFAAALDGRFGDATDRAVRGLQHDLMHNDGSSRGSDGRASIRLIDFNNGRVGVVDGIVDRGLASCIADMLEDPAYCKIPESANAAEDNRRIRAEVVALRGLPVPVPFLMAIFRQES